MNKIPQHQNVTENIKNLRPIYVENLMKFFR